MRIYSIGLVCFMAIATVYGKFFQRVLSFPFHFLISPLMPGVNKKAYVHKRTCSFYLQVCLSMYDLLLSSGIKRLKTTILYS